MGKERRRTRVTSLIEELPEEIKNWVDGKIADPRNTYKSISDGLKEKGHNISVSSIGRYALRTSEAMSRLQKAQAQTQQLVAMVQKNPNADYTEAGMMLLMDGLINRLATAEEEFDTIPLDKVGRLIASISRTKVYKDKVRQDMQQKAETAFKQLETEMLKVIKEDVESAKALQDILQRAKERMIADD